MEGYIKENYSMKLKQGFALMLSTFILAGCAQVSELNQKLADWAGEQIKLRDADKQKTSGAFTSKRDIDTLFIRVKREFNFESIEEALGCSPEHELDCRWREKAIREGGFIHERTPGVYYRMGHAVGEKSYYVEVTLEKEGKNTLVSYATRGSQAWADDVKTRLQKVIK